MKALIINDEPDNVRLLVRHWPQVGLVSQFTDSTHVGVDLLRINRSLA